MNKQQYVVVQCDDRRRFEMLVENKLSSGWQLEGGVSVLKSGIISVTYFQALSK